MGIWFNPEDGLLLFGVAENFVGVELDTGFPNVVTELFTTALRAVGFKT